MGAARWDAETRRYTIFYPDAEPINDLDSLSRGDALWVYTARDTRWAHPGTGQVMFEFADELSQDLRAEIREEVANVLAFFAERLGVYRDDVLVSVPYTGGCWAGPGFLKLNAHPSCTAHEYFHVLQFALADGQRLLPRWLTEGSATYAEELYDGDLDFRRAIAPPAASHVVSIRDPESSDVSLNYHLGFIATEWLIDQAGEDSLLTYYRLLPSSDSWEIAFAKAFGLSTDEFYDAFAAYRAEVAPPLPHLIDEVIKPIAVFLGDVPEETRAGIQEEMHAISTLLTDRFGADPAEYSVYFGSDWNAVAADAKRLSAGGWWDDRVRRFSLPLGGATCSRGATGWLVHAVDCERPLDHQSFINSYMRTLLVDKEQNSLSPLWIEAGGAIYVGLSYRSESRDAFDDQLGRHAGLVRQSSVQLEDLAPESGRAPKEQWTTGDNAENAALSVLAVDWLLRRAGERALFEYFRLLPVETYYLEPKGWQGPFEEAFGIAIDDFYEQFAEYRATLVTP